MKQHLWGQLGDSCHVGTFSEMLEEVSYQEDMSRISVIIDHNIITWVSMGFSQSLFYCSQLSG